jgi:hypothetical protein
MPLFGARLEIPERIQEECKRKKMLALNEWTIKIGPAFPHEYSQESSRDVTVNKKRRITPRGVNLVQAGGSAPLGPQHLCTLGIAGQ